MAEYLERETAVMRLMQDGCSAKTYRPSWCFLPPMLPRWCMGGGLRGRRRATTYLRHTDTNVRPAMTQRKFL